MEIQLWPKHMQLAETEEKPTCQPLQMCLKRLKPVVEKEESTKMQWQRLGGMKQ
jgi:hypothetical protein